MISTTIATPLGTLQLISDGESLVKIAFPDWHYDVPECTVENPALAKTRAQLDEYFAGNRQHFDLPLAPSGTTFQKTVWAALSEIPFGEVHSYGDIAKGVGRPSAVRAVGAANGRNPLPIVVPCHRVIGTDGSLTGFAGGLERKRQLLTLEGYL